MKLYFFLIIFSYLIQINNVVLANNSNYYDIKYTKKDLENISKAWTFSSNVFKDTQTKMFQYEDKIIHLDGNKNLIIVSLNEGKEICKNKGKPDRGKYRGIKVYIKNKSKNEVFAIFPRHDEIKLINIFDCSEKKLSKKITQKNLSAPILINKDLAILLPNGDRPQAYNLNTGELVWEAKIPNDIKKKLKKFNYNKKFSWDVWGGGVIDEKFNQIIFSTANAKPSFSSKGREGPNLFYNSVVSLNLNTGLYKWHFQEIEHDLLNLDMASAPVIFSKNNIDYVLQATKSGQLIVLDRQSGKTINNYYEKVFYHSDDKKIFTKKKIFEEWLQFSKSNFLEHDLNDLNTNFYDEAKSIVRKSTISEYKKLSASKNYIHYGFHGGNEWPGIAVTPNGDVIIPSNNIAWVSKLNDISKFNLLEEISKLIKTSITIFNLDYSIFKKNVKKTLAQFKKIINYKKIKIEKYQRFVNIDGIPLNSPPWGTLTSINIIDKKQNWQIPHGTYPNLDKKFKNTGSEVFGCPVILGKNIFFMSGTRDKKIYAYSINDGRLLWEDNLPFVSYGCPIISKYKNNVYLVINASGGAKFRDTEQGDKIITYKLK